MPNSVEFTARMEGDKVAWDGPDGNPAKHHRVHVPKGHPPHHIDFTFKDKTGLGLKFEDGDPFHVWEGDGCPPAGIATDQIDVVDSHPNKIRILNRNSGPPRSLRYQLNVIGKDGAKWPCDPIIDNDGGGHIE
jgi:hypothetical protein